MRMFIPEIGTRFTLQEDWTFTLHKEHRNDTVWEKLRAADPDTFEQLEAEIRRALDLMNEYRDRPISRDPNTRERNEAQWRAQLDHYYDIQKVDVTLPAGTEITLDRLYIRKGISDYSSATFNLNATNHPALDVKGRKRFWAKLQDVNRIEYAPLPEPVVEPDEGMTP
jgi:hypothetical protein